MRTVRYEDFTENKFQNIDDEIILSFGYDVDSIKFKTKTDVDMNIGSEGFLSDAIQYLWNALIRLFKNSASYFGELVEKFISVDFLMKQKIDYNADNLTGLIRACNNEEKQNALNKFKDTQAKFMLSVKEWESYLGTFDACTKFITALVHKVITTDTVTNVPETYLDIVDNTNDREMFSKLGIDITDIDVVYKNIFMTLEPVSSYAGLGFTSLDNVVEIDNRYLSKGWNNIRIVQSNRRELERHANKLEYELSRSEQYTKVAETDDKKNAIKNRLAYTRKSLAVIRMCTLYLVQVHRQFSRRRSTLIKDCSMATIKALPKKDDD